MPLIAIPAKGVRRQFDYSEHWPYTDKPMGSKPPTVSQRILGRNFIEACQVMGIDWTKYTVDREPPSEWNSLYPAAGGSIEDDDNFVYEHNVDREQSLMDLWQQAVDEVAEYFADHGEIDANLRIDGVDVLRRPQIGDEVDYVRKSRDDLDLLYGEPTEDRPSNPAIIIHPGTFLDASGRVYRGFSVEETDVPFEPGKWDGDARFGAQDNEICYEDKDGIQFIDLADPDTRNYFNCCEKKLYPLTRIHSIPKNESREDAYRRREAAAQKLLTPAS